MVSIPARFPCGFIIRSPGEKVNGSARFSPGKSKTPLQFFAKWGILVCWGEVYKALSPAMLVTASVPGALPAAPGDSFAGRKEESL